MAMTTIEVLAAILVLVAVLPAARSAILILAGIIHAGETLLISVASLRATKALLFPRRKERRPRIPQRPRPDKGD
jgi:hypothetical protein